jgi:hypothetical protein
MFPLGNKVHYPLLPTPYILKSEVARLFLDHRVDAFEARADFLEGERVAQSEVQVFREAVVGKVASLQRRASFETESGFQVRFGECAQEPGEAVVPFENVFADTQSTCACETIGKK